MARKTDAGFDYAGNLLEGLDLSRRAEVQSNPSPERGKVPARSKAAEKSPVKPRERKPVYPVKKQNLPWSKRMPNVSEDYVIPDEALYPDDDDDSFNM